MDYRELSGQLTKRSESCVLIGMSDIGGVPTWGWGHTGPEVRVGQAITQEQADIDFVRDQAHADAELRAHLPPVALMALTMHQSAALLDFVFNAGAGPAMGDKAEWQIWKDVRAGNLADVPTQLMRFVHVHVDGEVVTSKGLTNRRTAEVVMWNTADVEAAVAAANAGGANAGSAAIRVLPTPPQPQPAKALARTSLGVKMATVLSGTGAAVVQALPKLQDKAQAAHDIVTAHADMPHASAIAATLSAAVVCLGVAGLFIYSHQEAVART